MLGSMPDRRLPKALGSAGPLKDARPTAAVRRVDLTARTEPMGAPETPGLRYLPTVGEVLELPELRCGHPEVVAGKASLDRKVRWAHVSEIADIGHLLSGGELILTTGIALPDTQAELAGYVKDLVSAGASGVVIELGRRFQALPGILVERAEALALPLVVLHRETRFVTLTEALHAMIVNAQLKDLQTAHAVHEAFASSALESCSRGDIVRRAAELGGAPVVLENLAHQVVAFELAGQPDEEVLRSWEHRSREAISSKRSAVVGSEDWLVTVVSTRGEPWGRLVMLVEGEVTTHHIMVVEQAAVALTLNRLIERDEQTLERQTHRSLIEDIVARRYRSISEVHLRAQALGVPIRGKRMLAMVVLIMSDQPARGVSQQARAREDADKVAQAVRAARVSALVAIVAPGSIGVLVAAEARQSTNALLDRLAAEVRAVFASVTPARKAFIGVGSDTMDIDDLRSSFSEATEAVEAARDASGERAYYRISDVRLRGLLHMLRDDPRLQAFVERELGALLRPDQGSGAELLLTLGSYLDHGRNKATVASALGLSRSTLYRRLDQISHLLGHEVESVESCLSLQVAMAALQDQRRPLPGSPDGAVP